MIKMINVEVKINYENDELYCFNCKERIELTEKYIVIIEQLYDGEIIRKPVHLDCIEETYEDEEEQPFIHTI
jgi:hypothetical protein